MPGASSADFDPLTERRTRSGVIVTPLPSRREMRRTTTALRGPLRSKCSTVPARCASPVDAVMLGRRDDLGAQFGKREAEEKHASDLDDETAPPFQSRPSGREQQTNATNAKTAVTRLHGSAK